MSQLLHHGDNDDIVIFVLHGVGHPHHLMLVSGWGLPGVHVGVWGLDRAGARPLTHHVDRDDDPVVVLYGRGCPYLWVCCLTPVLKQQACGWMWAKPPAHSHSFDDDDDVIVVTSVVGDSRGPGWDPVGNLG